MTETSLQGHCHCRRVAIALPRRPDYLNDCDCSLCASHGAIWGYFTPAEVVLTGETTTYVRADMTEPAVRLHFCGFCGSTTHWSATPAFARRRPGLPPRMGVNMRLFAQGAVAGLELRFPDGRNWSGVGPDKQRRPGVTLGPDGFP